ncbi:MAG: glycosyltransferase [Tissierellia bacterium]|nr:glycosyltransferase [Tissierellia bacterium]
MITVITPVYNKEKFIEKTINSVLNQTYKDFEYLLVNDGSTDKSKEIIEQYDKKDKRISLINQENKGASAARNVGIENAKGEYILNIDADDLLYDNALEITIKNIKDNDLLLYKTLHKFPDKEMIKPRRKAVKDNFLLHYLKDYWVNHNAILVRRDYLMDKNIRYREDLNYGEDVLFLIHLLSNTKKIIAIDDVLNIYNREIADSLSAENIKNIDRDKIWIDIAENYLEEKNLLREKRVLIDYIKAGNIYQRLNYNKNDPEFKLYYDRYKDLLKNVKIVNGLRSVLLKKKIHDFIKSVEK